MKLEIMRKENQAAAQEEVESKIMQINENTMTDDTLLGAIPEDDNFNEQVLNEDQ